MTATGAVLFDAVGTLIRPNPTVAKAYLAVGRRHGVNLTEAEVAQRFRIALAQHSTGGPTNEGHERARWRAIVAQVFRECPSNRQEPMFEALWEHFSSSQNWQLFPDVIPAWKQLDDSGFALGIASNFDQRLAVISRDLTPLDRADWLFCSSQLGYSKPSMRFFQAIEQRLSLSPAQILLVGDNRECDVTAARQAGWQAIHLDRDGRSRAHDSIRSLVALLDHL